MRVLLAAGSGVIGSGVIPGLLERGHHIRLVSHRATADAAEWPEGVEAYQADIADYHSLLGAAEDRDVVIHLAEGEAEHGLEQVNVRGTRALLREAERAGQVRFLFASSLGADRDQSEYQRWKRAGERMVERYQGPWTILRPGLVYGPDDETMTALLAVVRSFPAVPLPGVGKERVQPVWYRDLGSGIARATERSDLDGRTLALAGADTVTLRELLNLLRKIEGRHPPALPVPRPVARLGMEAGRKLRLLNLLERVTGLDLPTEARQTRMLGEESYISEPADNALVEVLGITPTPLEEGLRRLTVEMPEHLPQEGVGPLHRSTFEARIRNPELSAASLMAAFRREITDLMPVGFVGGGAQESIRTGDTLELHLPGRGNVAVRVEETGPHSVTLATLEGHPLAGFVRFLARPAGDGLRFTILVYSRPAGYFDWVLMHSGGHILQRANWRSVVRRVADRSGGATVGGVSSEHLSLDEAEAQRAVDWIRTTVRERLRSERMGMRLGGGGPRGPTRRPSPRTPS